MITSATAKLYQIMMVLDRSFVLNEAARESVNITVRTVALCNK